VKKKNQRIATGPAPKTKRQRFLQLSWSFSKACLGLALVGGTAVATAWGGYHLALSSSRFALRKLDVDASHRLSDREVAEHAGVRLGDNLLSIDLHAAEEKLLRDPWLKSVRITRKLPDTLRIQMLEHEASALASLDGQLFLVDADAEPFKAWQPGDTTDLPVLTGVTLEDLARDRAGAVNRLATGLSVLEHYSRLSVSHAQRPQEVNLAGDGSVVLSIGGRGISLHLGQGPWPKKLLMVAEVLRTFEHKKELPGVVFLDNALHPERVVVRLR
jgi:cell division protein FtsQ